MNKAFREDLARKLGPEALEKIGGVRVGLAGAGGLGSNCALNLVRVGFVKLTIVDFDVIDGSNLDRQFYFEDQIGMKKVEALKVNLLRVNPSLEIEAIDRKVAPENAADIFRDCGFVAECLDRAEAKSFFVETMLAADKFVVSVSGLGGTGLTDEITTRYPRRNWVLIGDLKSDISEKPALSPRVNIAASKQADALLERALGKEPPSGAR